MAGDFHFPFVDKNCFELFLRYIRQFKPHYIVLNGDVFDAYLVSRFAKSRNIGFKTFKAELDADKGYFDTLLKACGKAKVIFIDGNHEVRLPNYLKMMAPTLEDMDGLQMEQIFEFAKRGIVHAKAKAQSGIYRITDKLACAHGWYTGSDGNSVAKRTWNQVQQSIITSHSHKEGTYRVRGGLDGKESVALVTGCLCQPQDYLDLDTWARGFVAGMVNLKTGEFTADHVRISGENFGTLYAADGTMRI